MHPRKAKTAATNDWKPVRAVATPCDKTSFGLMRRRFSTFVGIDLGGGRGKTTAVARLELASDVDDDPDATDVVSAMARAPDGSPWHDDALLALLAELPDNTVVAVDAPLTVPACVRCPLSACPGQAACADPATVWLNTVGAGLVAAAAAEDRDRIAAVPAGRSVSSADNRPASARRPLVPYSHRCTAVHLHYARGVETRETLGQQAGGPVTARAAHLRRAAASSGFALNENLIEVSPRATVHALFGERRARYYKRDADPWRTRAGILEGLGDTLRFAPRSRMSREGVLSNDHCFDAVLSAYTAFLWARDGWELPADNREVFEQDGWIWAPPE